MPAKKKRSRKPKLLTRVINWGILGLALSKPISILIGPGTSDQKINNLVLHASMGMAGEGGGKFDKQMALAMYGPMGAAWALKKVISELRKTLRV